MPHRYINFKFNEAGGRGCLDKNGTLAKFGQKTGTYTHFWPIFACFYIRFCIFLHIYRYFDKELLGTMFGWFGEKTGTFEEYIPVPIFRQF